MSCCPSGSWPLLLADASYAAKGEQSVIGKDLPVYVVGDGSTGKGVIVLPEVFGFQGRLKNICDTIAENGYTVIMPDCHRGETAEGKEDLLGWVKGCEEKNPVCEDMKAVLELFESKGVKSVSAIGHCWGVWAWKYAAAEGVLKDLKCGIGPHPSTKLEEYAFGRSQDDLCKKIVATCGGKAMPVLIMTAGNDPDNVKTGGSLIEILGAETVDFPDQSHGWFSRGDISDAAVKAAVEKTMELALMFLKRHH